MICASGSRTELSCRNDVITITVYFFAANKSYDSTCLLLMLNSRILGLI